MKNCKSAKTFFDFCFLDASKSPKSVDIQGINEKEISENKLSKTATFLACLTDRILVVTGIKNKLEVLQ